MKVMIELDMDLISVCGRAQAIPLNKDKKLEDELAKYFKEIIWYSIVGDEDGYMEGIRTGERNSKVTVKLDEGENPIWFDTLDEWWDNVRSDS